MARNLDLTALRAFAAVAETGGVTRAAGVLNLTQSAVSMQVKRLETALDVGLLERTGRGVTLTAAGEQLLSYARRMLALNDEAMEKMTAQEFEGEIVLGVPHDIVPFAIPQVLRAFNAEFPRMQVQLLSSFTLTLRRRFEDGQCDMFVATEEGLRAGGETLGALPLVWVGAPEGIAWRRRPLPLAFEDSCIHKSGARAALDRAGVPWSNVVASNNTRAIEATVGADLAITASLDGFIAPGLEPIGHNGALPVLGAQNVNLYVTPTRSGEAIEALRRLLRQVYGDITSMPCVSPLSPSLPAI
jgi:DNA-binding transcriptional LysR family regulator